MGRDVFFPPGIPAGAAGPPPPDVAAALDVLRDQLVLVLVQRLGGRVVVTPSELRDAQGALAFRLDPTTRAFTFTLEPLQ